MAEEPCVGVAVANLFLRVPVVAAVRASGGRALDVADLGAAAATGCTVAIVDLEALGPDPGPVIRAAASRGVAVLAFAPDADGRRLDTARTAGATVLPRSFFLRRLPELLPALLGRGEHTT